MRRDTRSGCWACRRGRGWGGSVGIYACLRRPPVAVADAGERRQRLRPAAVAAAAVLPGRYSVALYQHGDGKWTARGAPGSVTVVADPASTPPLAAMQAHV